MCEGLRYTEAEKWNSKLIRKGKKYSDQLPNAAVREWDKKNNLKEYIFGLFRKVSCSRNYEKENQLWDIPLVSHGSMGNDWIEVLKM